MKHSQTQAERWHQVCTGRLPPSHAFVQDRISRAILTDAAYQVIPIGLGGLMWFFNDESAVVSHPGTCAVVINSASAERAVR